MGTLPGPQIKFLTSLPVAASLRTLRTLTNHRIQDANAIHPAMFRQALNLVGFYMPHKMLPAPVGVPFSLIRSQRTVRVHKGRENLFKLS